MKLKASGLATIVGGRLAGMDTIVEGASIDTRELGPGQLFVAVEGARDGHDFLTDAAAAGASCCLTARGGIPPGLCEVRVSDTRLALAALGRWARDQLDPTAAVVGVTGSTGKTSTKDLLAAVLARRWRTVASARSFNNELGLPLTLFGAEPGSEAMVLEMGARGPGDIAHLCEIARPTLGVLTNVGPAHLERFGSLEGVASAKAELVDAVGRDGGTVVLNAEDERVRKMADRTAGPVVWFGRRTGDVHAEGGRVSMGSDQDRPLSPRFRLVSPWGAADVRVAGAGEHQADNALAAAAAALALGVPLEDVVAGLDTASCSPWRMELTRTRSGAIVCNDAYNANPASTEAALRSLAALPASRRIAVLGPMLELGAESDAEHARLGELARSRYGINHLLTVGAPDYGGQDVAGIDDALEVLDALGPLGRGDAVLVKASRAAGLERLAQTLVERSCGGVAPPEPTATGTGTPGFVAGGTVQW
ncbi:MAG: UDP-N-acetylmuramoyl-tripeptide--D-alanyl-D-alanine ligase [Acidimicrobiales bacterium]